MCDNFLPWFELIKPHIQQVLLVEVQSSFPQTLYCIPPKPNTKNQTKSYIWTRVSFSIDTKKHRQNKNTWFVYESLKVKKGQTFDSSKDFETSAAAAFLVLLSETKTFLILGRTLDFQYPMLLFKISPFLSLLLFLISSSYNYESLTQCKPLVFPK